MNLVATLSPLILICIIILGAIAIFFSGRQLILYSDDISKKTGLSHAFVGMLFLAVATSLPEIATTITASIIDNPPLAINNLVGGVVIQTAILPFADFIYLKRPLTTIELSPSLLMAALFLILQLAIVVIGFSIGEKITFAWIGFWPILLTLLYLLLLQQLRQKKEKKVTKKTKTRLSKQKLFLLFALNALVVLIAGYFVALSTDSLSAQTNLTSSFLGATLVAIVTSLPEITTTLYAVKRKAYTLAFANIFGSNALMMGILLLSDATLRKSHLFNHFDISTVYLAGLGILVTALYAWGLLEKKTKRIIGIGIDSFFVLLSSIIGFVFLYHLTKGTLFPYG